jgi:hypothetical protein
VSVWYKSICPSVSHTNPAETGDGAAAYIIDANGGFHTLLGLTCTNNNTWVQRSFAIPSSFGGTTMRVSLRNYDTTQAQCQSQFSCGGWVNWTATQSLFDDLVITPS